MCSPGPNLVISASAHWIALTAQCLATLPPPPGARYGRAMPPPVILQAPWRDPVAVLGAVADRPWTLGFLSGGEDAEWSYVLADPEAVLSLAGDDPRDPFEALRALAEHIAFDPQSFLTIDDIKAGRRSIGRMDARELFRSYWQSIEIVTDAVDRLLHVT